MILEPHEPTFNVATKEEETFHRRRGKKKFEMAQEKGDDCLTKQHLRLIWKTQSSYPMMSANIFRNQFVGSKHRGNKYLHEKTLN